MQTLLAKRGDTPTTAEVIAWCVKDDAAMSYTWSLYVLTPAGRTPSPLDLSDTDAITSTGGAQENIELLPNVLGLGATYSFVLTATWDDAGTPRTATSAIEIVVNTPPFGGTLSLGWGEKLPGGGWTSPAMPRALSDAIALTASSWTDEVADLPLSYRFLYRESERGAALSRRRQLEEACEAATANGDSGGGGDSGSEDGGGGDGDGKGVSGTACAGAAAAATEKLLRALTPSAEAVWLTPIAGQWDLCVETCDVFQVSAL